MKSHDGPPCLRLYATTANLLQQMFLEHVFYLVRQLVLTHGYQESMPRSPCYQSSPKPIHKRSGVSRITESSKAWVLLGMPLCSSRITNEKRPVAPVLPGLIGSTRFLTRSVASSQDAGTPGSSERSQLRPQVSVQSSRHHCPRYWASARRWCQS